MTDTSERVCHDCAAPIGDGPGLPLCAACSATRGQRAFWGSVPAGLERLLTIVGPEYVGATLADFQPPIVQRGIDIFRRAKNPAEVLYGVLVMGEVGRGKTHFAAALVRLWVLAGGASVRWLLTRTLRRGVTGAEGGDNELIDTQITTDLLVLDDTGREGPPSEYLLGVLHEILDERIRWHRPTILTTNLGDDLGDRYGVALASRLALYETVVIRGEDRREACA